MKNVTFWDTETSGIPLYYRDGAKVASDDPGQPHVIQLAAKRVDFDTKEILGEVSRIIKPDGFTISDFIAELTGITQERAMDEGVSRKEALDEFVALCDQSELCVAHNDNFDRKMIRISLIREFGRETANAWYCKEGRGFFCTMKASTPVCKIPPTGKMVKAGFDKFKSPKLEEAYQFFFGKKPDVCHDAMADVNSTVDIFFELVKRGVSIEPRYFTERE
jgi:DNA polymerase-3 subunit epsilon